MSFFYSPFYSPLYDIFDDIATAVEQAQDSLAQDPNYQASRKAIQGKPQKGAASTTGKKASGSSKAVQKAPAQQPPQSLLSTILSSDPFFSPSTVDTSKIIPALNIHENDKSYTLTVSVPGALKDKLNINLNKDTNELSIKGEIPAPDFDDDDTSVVHSEIPAGQFERTLKLPTSVNGEKIKASFKNGILTLEIPKLDNDDNIQPIEITETDSVETN